LLSTAVEALSRDDQLKFVFVGAGDIVRAELEARVAGIGLSDSIKFVGRRLDVPRFMAASTCLLFPSLEEGLGMVAVEAQSAGLRVLASHVVPRECVVVPELVSFRQLNDGPAAWADELLAMSALPRFDSKRANEAVHESSFSIDKSYDALHRLYSGLSV
jgi:Glycosyltransferase